MRKEWGFTLIELMMVVTIMSILSALALPMYADKVRKTRVQEAVDTIGPIRMRLIPMSPREVSPPPLRQPQANPRYHRGSGAGEREMGILGEE
jgi:prepilin-type N-terminal cleavage/methylation domain-containing protein